jgi:hypothetical protein
LRPNHAENGLNLGRGEMTKARDRLYDLLANENEGMRGPRFVERSLSRFGFPRRRDPLGARFGTRQLSGVGFFALLCQHQANIAFAVLVAHALWPVSFPPGPPVVEGFRTSWPDSSRF